MGKPIGPDFVYEHVSATAPNLSADGSRLVFVETRVDREAMEYRSRLMIRDMPDGETRAFTSGDSDGGPRFSPDGQTVAFLRPDDILVFDVKILRALSTYQFTDRFLLRNITEYNTFDKRLGLNLLFTYRVNAGTAFYIGYDDHYRQGDLIFDDLNGDGYTEQVFPAVTALQRTNRALFTKFQYLFRY